MRSKIIITLLMAIALSSCNNKKDNNDAIAIKGGGNKVTSTLVTDLMKMQLSMNKDLNLRDGEKENLTDEINGQKVEYTKYTYAIQNNKIVKRTETVGPTHCTLTAALRADINPDNAVLEAHSRLSLNKAEYNGKAEETNGSGTSSSKLTMALGYGQKTTATVLNIVCVELTTLEELRNQIGEFIAIEKAEDNKSK